MQPEKPELKKQKVRSNNLTVASSIARGCWYIVVQNLNRANEEQESIG